MFILLAGSSGAGKNTVIKALEKRDEKYKLMPTYTTREKREGEVHGYPYYFVSREEFQQLIKNNELLEHEKIHNNYYGSSKKIIEEFLKDDKLLIKDIDVYGAQNIYTKLNPQIDVLRVFLTTKNKAELKRRLKQRGEKNIKLRLKRFKLEQKEMIKFDYIILNNDLDKTCDIVDSLEDANYLDFIPTLEYKKLKLSKVKKYISDLQSGKLLKPIKLLYKDGKTYILKGHEKLIAEIYSGKVVAKMYVDYNKSIKLVDENSLYSWHQLILKQDI